MNNPEHGLFSYQCAVLPEIHYVIDYTAIFTNNQELYLVLGQT